MWWTLPNYCWSCNLQNIGTTLCLVWIHSGIFTILSKQTNINQTQLCCWSPYTKSLDRLCHDKLAFILQHNGDQHNLIMPS